MKKIIIINGPNLNLLGKRQPEIYGNITFEDFFKELKSSFESIQLEYYQSNVEGDLVNKLQEVGFSYSGIVFNAGGYTHTSVAIADAVASLDSPTIEVHISNVYAREEFRHQSLMAANCKGVIAGFGLNSYKLAVEALL
ncbi:MAG: type II 3-dehydroquinate dehydratase [Bacteroidota bacterium]|nr:type II 3-dehydroquinate dehydratase [Bacteroidota bacterium]